MPVVVSDAILIALGAGDDALIVLPEEDVMLAVNGRHLAMTVTLALPNVDVWAAEEIAFTVARFPSGVGT